MKNLFKLALFKRDNSLDESDDDWFDDHRTAGVWVDDENDDGDD